MTKKIHTIEEDFKTINSESIIGEGDIEIGSDPAGSDTEIQFNDDGEFGAVSKLKWADEQLQVEGEEVDLSGESVTGLTGEVVSPGGIAGGFVNYDSEVRLRVWAYKLIGGVPVVTGSTTSAIVEYEGGSQPSYSVSFSWDALTGADGYFVAKELFLPAFNFAFNSFTQGVLNIGNSTTYTVSSTTAFNQPTPTQTNYFDEPIKTNGSINIQGGALKFNGNTAVSLSPENGLSIGGGVSSPNSVSIGGGLSGTESIDLQSGRTDDFNSAFGTRSFAVGFDNRVNNSGLAIGQGNNIETPTDGMAFGRDNKILSLGSRSITIGQENLASEPYTYLIGRRLSAIKRGLLFGVQSTFTQIPNIISLTDRNFGINTNSALDGHELNKDTSIMDMENGREANIIENPNIMQSGANWNFNSSECTQFFNRIVKDTNGTSPITPPSLLSPLVVGRKYALYIFFNPGDGFVGTVNLTMGGRTLGTFRGTGGYWLTFTAQSTDTLTLTPSNDSRFGLFNAYVYPITGGDLNVLGNIITGDNLDSPDDIIASNDDVEFNKNQVDKDFIVSSENVGEMFKVDASEDTALFGGDVKVTDSDSGLILKSPNGTEYRIKINNDGTLDISSV